ncbi:MAG: type II toxin-antitoxin system HipA family toxin [Deltaproteobacteria bacterium]|jgi:serine/threonine-protein kinase HipA|nr:type II toxin-antitoxin system HipA family toxin [Deltaproteobacteria bacterium]
MTRQLSVWLFGTHIGTLSQIDGRLSFAYSRDWLNTSNSIPLSQSLPLQAEAFDDRASRPFFAGLLPEGDKRKLIAQTLHVSRQNDFALLDGIGGECAGAVTLLEPGQTPQTPDNQGLVRWLDETELLHLLNEMPKRPMLAGEEGLRLSLAGAQDKLPVVAEGNRIGLPLFNSPSSHILKPVIAGVEGSVFNEGFCLALANALKLDTVKAEIRRISDRHYLLVERYDRQVTADGRLMRLHQEDFCQALSVAPEYKYQNEGGPDLSQAFELLRRATRPSAPQILKLLDFAIFNAMVGNHDAHGKNFSLLYTTQGIVLAPCYDVLATAVYPNLTDKMAMKIGSKYRFSEVQMRHWERFASEAGLSPAQVKKRILNIAGRLPALAAKTITVFEAGDNGHAILPQIMTLIEQRCALTIRCLTSEQS